MRRLQPAGLRGVAIDRQRTRDLEHLVAAARYAFEQTPAALFSEAGATALVYGPGDIAQAHTAGEWVALAELAEAATTYRRLLGQPRD